MEKRDAYAASSLKKKRVPELKEKPSAELNDDFGGEACCIRVQIPAPCSSEAAVNAT